MSKENEMEVQKMSKENDLQYKIELVAYFANHANETLKDLTAYKAEEKQTRDEYGTFNKFYKKWAGHTPRKQSILDDLKMVRRLSCEIMKEVEKL